MLTAEQAEQLGAQLESLRCTNPGASDGLFLFVLKGEPAAEAGKYAAHLSECEYCRITLQLHRYRRDVAKLVGHGSEDAR